MNQKAGDDFSKNSFSDLPSSGKSKRFKSRSPDQKLLTDSSSKNGLLNPETELRIRTIKNVLSCAQERS